jgi:formylglycine-generating enzyme required for sulfatase activity
MNVCLRLMCNPLFGLTTCVLLTSKLAAQTVFAVTEAQVTSTAGQVNVTSASGTKITDLYVPTASGEKPITAMHRPGAIIQTGPDSQATLAIPGAGTMLMDADTEVRLPKAGDKAQSLELLRGKLFLNISAEEVKKQGEASFRLKTPAALLAVKGTKFFASVEKGRETAGVHEGQIGAFAMASRQLNQIQTGNALSIIKGKPEPPRLLTDEEKRQAIRYELAAGEGRFTNSLGMKFVAVPGTNVLFCIHETRVKDFSAFNANKYSGFTSRDSSELPATNVSWYEISPFLDWLGAKESRRYRLPTDLEWSMAAGIGRQEQKMKNATWRELNGKITKQYPWGSMWPPPRSAGNYCDESYHADTKNNNEYIKGYDDGHPAAAPVMSFNSNHFGLYDLGGNVWEMLAPAKPLNDEVLLRGASYNVEESSQMLSSYRRIGNLSGPESSKIDHGFRIVLEVE